MTQKGAGSGSFRILHTMIRVRDLEKSIDFYCQKLGMDLLRKTDYPDGKFTLAFVGYGDGNAQALIELTHNWDKDTPYEMGDSWGHVAIGVKDIHALCNRLEKAGVPIPRPPGPMKHGSTILAFIDDPDGHKIELIQT